MWYIVVYQLNAKLFFVLTYFDYDSLAALCYKQLNGIIMSQLIDWLIDCFIYIRGKPEKAAIAYLAGDLIWPIMTSEVTKIALYYCLVDTCVAVGCIPTLWF